MHFVFAIPTFNRVSYLKKNIEALVNQNLNSKVNISICVSNTASSDDTMNYLNNLKETNKNVFINNKKLENENENLGSLASIIPSDADWVWYLGDDDILMKDDALLKVVNLIENNNIDFIHVSQYRRSNRNEELIHKSVSELCNTMGYTEILGWISSLIVKRIFFVQALEAAQTKMSKNCDKVSAFTHSYFFYKELYDKKGVFYNSGLVDPQDIRQTEESIKRWAHENMPARYLNVMDDFQLLNNYNLLPKKLNTIFFRYQNINLWDRWIIYLLNETVRADIPLENKLNHNYLAEFNNNWEKLIKFCDLIADNNLQKYVLNIIKTSMGLCVKYLFDEYHREAYKIFIIDQINLLKTSCYDFKTFK